MTEKKTKKTDTNKKALQVWVGEDKMSVAKTKNAQIDYLSIVTPDKYILQRQGRGGLTLDYVETNYVIGRLNATFIFNWDIEVVETLVEKEMDQIAIQVRLTVRFADGAQVVKTAWGGSTIKRMKEGKAVMDLANDIKSAESDAIKKAASMLGICWDVYSGLTKSGKPKKEEEKEEKAIDDYEQDDRNEAFRTISITIQGKTIMHTKFEALNRFKEAKKNIGDELYYKILGEHGYEKSNEIPTKDIPKIYYAMVDAYKTKKPNDKPEEKDEQGNLL